MKKKNVFFLILGTFFLLVGWYYIWEAHIHNVEITFFLVLDRLYLGATIVLVALFGDKFKWK
ncbi:hypothetical protein [Brevibacillus laterosporus]|uniref:Uncharacterized protein n=1 Tax=Brevibacillus laterosporus TaxID=1465 RepID=A0AAP8U5F0_BRELA|nr:hypothetical protein [Brevibacillus laterosporus]PPB02422.1 hypothetical protein C4A77_11865 [Brevibacillus laterosporus]